MRIAIIDSNYSDQKYSGLAASWLRWELQKAKIAESKLDEADTVFITVSSQQGVSSVRSVARKLKNRNTRIILGGGGCYAPAIFDNVANAICVGEGQNFVRLFLRGGYDAIKGLPETWIPNQTREVIPNRDFCWDVPPIKHPDGSVRVFGSRGCKYRCLFCQTGWENTYRVNPNPEILQRHIDILTAQNERLAIVTNDGAERNVTIRGQQEFLSVRLDNLKYLMPLTRERVKSVRIGVEGISERLRIAVGKPVYNDDLLNATFDLLNNGVGVRWFFIAGLPGELDGDYSEMHYLINGLKRLQKGCVMLNFHAFIPQPATPLCVLPLRDEYWERFDEFRRWFFSGEGFTRHVQIIAPSKYPNRLKRAMESMSATETELRRGWFDGDNLNWRVKYLFAPDRLRTIANIYAGRVGERIEKETHETPRRVETNGNAN